MKIGTAVSTLTLGSVQTNSGFSVHICYSLRACTAQLDKG